MSCLRLILGDQLSMNIATLDDCDRKTDVILMCELDEETRYVPHHQQKITLVLSAMRHFAQRLRDEGYTVDYVELTDEENQGSFSDELARAIDRHKPKRIIVTQAGEWRLHEVMQGWQERLGLPVEIREDSRFLCSIDRFRTWAKGRKTLRMEHFYREMRRETGWLMDGDAPAGGEWNYDSDNRKRLPKGTNPPPRKRFVPDDVTQAVIDLVRSQFAENFGDAREFDWPVTREDALRALSDFIEECLPFFGDFQDAMASGEDFLYHSLLSTSLNIGLLDPREVCEAALEAYAGDAAPLNAVEGFIRQILGWREYVRGIYFTRIPEYAQSNFLEARRALPAFYWTGKTRMNCMAQCIEATRRNAYAHHIQRLMVTGNFALLAGLDPVAVNEWYLVVYADAFEWVEMPNTHGMVLHADGGLLGSKPYAASGAYINRMLDYCRDCSYDPKLKTGPKACPFNYLYWNFLIVNTDKLKGNPRLGMPYRNLEKMSQDRRQEIQRDSQAFLDSMDAQA